MKSRFQRRFPAFAAGLFTLLALALADTVAWAGQLTIDIGGSRTFDTAALLARPEVKTIDVPTDASYGRAMSYRAVPFRALVDAAALPPGKMVQFVAADGFVSTLSAALLFPSGGDRAEAWLAIETPDAPWPNTPGGAAPGPFYLVWLRPEASGVLQEHWPYNVARVQLVDAPTARWPHLAVGDDAPAESSARKGQTLVAGQCMVCHRLDGAGDSDIGPDLVRPHSPTDYLQPWALRALIRDPGSVRNWPDRRMPAFSKEVLSDADLDAIAAYLAYLADRRK